MKKSRAAALIPLFLRNLIIVPVYFGAASIGLSLAFRHTNISPVWPPSGIAVASILLFGYSVFPGVAVGAFLANYLTGLSLLTSIGIATGNTLEALCAAYLAKRFSEAEGPLDTTRNVFAFLVLSGMFSSMIAASIGTSSVYFGGFGSGASFFYLWWTWWLGDTVGIVVVAPLIIAWFKGIAGFDKKDVYALALLALAIFASGMIDFGGHFETNTPFTYLTLPLVTLAAFRFEQRGASLAIVVLSGIALWGTRNNFGPFVAASLHESLLFLQLFIGIIAATGLLVAAGMFERRKAQQVIHRQLAEKELLLQEVHHRVKNNLQLISSLLRLQARNASDETKVKLLESLSRIQSMALVHDRLYRGGEFLLINMNEYIQDLSTLVFSSFNAKGKTLRLEIDCKDIFVEINKAIPCGLIINEALTNSLKYAFEERSSGLIRIQLQKNGDALILLISDDGVGLSEAQIHPSSETLGLRLIRLLVQQLAGTFDIQSNGGTKLNITFVPTDVEVSSLTAGTANRT
jgi:two-component sensor histidine kinase/integral membrane sensor domain MASE1